MTRFLWLALVCTALARPALAQVPEPEPEPETETESEPESESEPEPESESGSAGPVVVPPALTRDAQPVFPAAALEDRVQAVAVVELTIDATGQVTAATVGSLTLVGEDGDLLASDGRYGFGEAAVDAARRLEFSPATYGGQPFEVQINYTYRFSLPPRPGGDEGADADEPEAPPRVNYRGQLIERGTRGVVPGATVTVYRGEGEDAEGFEATSSADGAFEFYDLPAGTWQVRIERDGYVPVETDETISASEVVEGKYWIEKGTYSEYDLTVEAERPRKEVNRRSLSVEQIAQVPGVINDDPVLVIENLPGVARSGFGSGDIIVRGSGPEDTGVFINGIGVPLIYHFGGLKSVVPSSVVGGIDFYPGNYSVQYGRALGGVFDLQLKRLDPDIVHGKVDISVLDTSLYLEVPLGDDAAIAFAGRRSYVDFVLEATIPESVDLALTSAPRYYDYQILGNWRPRREHEIRWLALGSDDLLRILFDDPGDPGVQIQSNSLSAQTFFQRLIADYRYTPDETVSNLLRLSVGRDDLNFSLFGTFGFDAELFTIAARDNFTVKLSDNVTLETGFDNALGRFEGTIALPSLNSEGQPDDGDLGSEEVLEQTIAGDWGVDLAAFLEARISVDRLSLVPGLRVDYFDITKDVSLDPRLVARYQISDTVAAKGGAAVVHQGPDFPEVDEVFGNPDLGLQRAIQYSVGAEWRPLEYLSGDLTFFYKDLDNLVSPTDALVERDGQMVEARFDNNGTGKVYGAEVFIKHDFSRGFNGWISYTISRAERTDSGENESRLFDFDQTHILALVASYELNNAWRFGARWRLVSGNPDTPVVGSVFNVNNDRYDPIFGDVNSTRLPMFRQLDLRVDRTWLYDSWRLSAYLSLVNAVNSENVEALTYNFDYSEQGSVNGLPVLPIIGIKGEF